MALTVTPTQSFETLVSLLFRDPGSEFVKPVSSTACERQWALCSSASAPVGQGLGDEPLDRSLHSRGVTKWPRPHSRRSMIVRRSRRGYGVAADDFGYFLVVFFAGAFLAGAAFLVRVRAGAFLAGTAFLVRVRSRSRAASPRSTRLS